MNNNFFLEGLLTARDIVRTQGLLALESLIEEHKSGQIQTAAVRPDAETR